MSKRIVKDDIAEKGVLDNILNPLREFMTMLKTADDMIKTFSADAKKQLAFKTDAKGMREQEALQRKINSAYQQKIRLEKETARVESEQVKMYDALVKQIKKREDAEAKAHAKREAQYNKEIKQAEELNRPYNKLSATLNNLRKEYRDLAVSGQNNTKRARELKGQIDQLDRSLKKVDADMGVFGRNVGNYTGAISKGFKSAIGFAQQFGLALGSIALARGAIDTIVQFDAAIADLSAITGATDTNGQLEFFRKNAIQLGKDVKGGAAAVVEAYKLIASAKPELLENAAALNDVTKATILLSKASGMELPDAATALTDAMNQFGAGADQAGKFVDVLAAGAKFGSAEIPQITEALLRFGAVAKTSNVGIQESTALIEDLAEKGLKGADAGTALRNVMLKLSAPDALPKEAQERLKALGVNFDDLRNKSLPFSKRLEALKPLLKDNAALVKTFGTENAVAATVLIGTTDRIADLTEKLDENGVAQEQADARSKTLSEAFNRLKEGWNSMILEFASGKTNGLTDFIDFLAENLPTIVSLILKLAAAFVTFKGVMASMRLADRVKDFLAMRKAIKESGDAMNSGSSGAKAFGQTLKGIGFTAVIALAAQLATELYNIASGARQAALDISRIEAGASKGAETAQERISAAQINRDKAILEAQDLKNKGKITEIELTKRTQKANEDYEKSIQSMADQSRKKQQENFKQYEAAVKALDDYRKKVGDARFEILRTEGAALREGGISGAAAAGISAADIIPATQLDTLIQRISVLKAQQENASSRNKAYMDELFGINKASIEGAAGLDELGKSFDDSGDKIEDYTQKVRELQDARIKDAQTRDEMQLKSKLDADLADIKDNGIKANELRIELEKTYQEDLLKLQKQYNLLRIEAEYEYWDAVAAAQQQAKADFEAFQNELFQQEIKSITDRDKALEIEMLKSGKTDEEIEKAKLERRKESLRQQIEVARFYGMETIDLELELARLERDADLKKDQDEKKRLEEMAKFRNDLIKRGTDYLTDQIDKQIAQLDKQAQAASQQQQYLEGLAEAGNIRAQDSIVEQQRLQEEADRKKIDLERKKANITALSAVLQTYNNKASSGDKFPLASTIIDSGALFQFLNTIPKYFYGTEDTGSAGALKDQYGNITGVTHEHERVMSERHNKRLNGASNEDVVKVYERYGTGNMIYRENFIGATAGTSFDIAPLLKKHDELIGAIEGLPAKELSAEQIGSMMYILSSDRTPNFHRRNRWKLDK